MHGELPKNLTAKAGSRARRNIAILLLLVAVAAAAVYIFSGTSQQQQQRRGRFAGPTGPVPVLAATASHADVPVYLDAVGTVRALNTVTVRPQIDGKLIEVDFKEGQDVRRGDVLARIDPTTFKAQLDQAVAKKAQDEAVLTNARNDLERYEKLAAINAINKQQADTQRALVAQYTAQVQADQAAIENAQATLNYATIRAPIDGRTGLRQVDEGNIVRTSDSAGIVVITQIKPIAVLFNLPQQDINAVNAAFAREALPVDALRSDTGAVIERGTLTVVDNLVDASTGTVKLKAEFPNAGLTLWPGQFVNVRLLISTLKQVVTIPTGAVQRGPSGTFVYVIGDDGTASVRPIQVQKQDETLTVVASGLAPPERVVTTGFARLTDGTKITVGGGAPMPAAGTPGTRPQGAQPGNGPRPDGAAGSSERRQRGGDNAARPAAPQ
jgi:multidrug efflux system membrane fusion protein